MKAFYKIILLLYGCYFSLAATAQNLNLVSPITISLPNTPAVNTDDWGKGAQPFIITAKKNTPNELQSWMLVTIKKGGSKICGSNTPQTAPEVYFDVPLKTWVGTTAISQLGNGCVLQPGDYELCVQFYLKDRRTIIGENCKSFTIKESKPETYSPPQNILPAPDKKFTAQEANSIINFRWTPIVPKPKEKVKYTVRIWDINIGASKNQAIKNQQPIIIKETNELTQLSIPSGELRASKNDGNAYAWNVEASKTSALGDIEILGTSEATEFSIKTNDAGSLVNQTPVDGKIFTKAETTRPILFSWAPVLPMPKEKITYRLRVWILKNGQSPVDAIKNNVPALTTETNLLIHTPAVCDTFEKPCECFPGCDVSPYIWTVQALQNGKIFAESEPFTFSVSSAGCGTNDANVTLTCGKIINGKQTYNAVIKFYNIIPASGGQQCTTVMNGITSATGIITGLATLPVTIPVGGNSSTINFIYTPATAAATTATFSYLGIWNDGSNNTSNFTSSNVPIPICKKPSDCNCKSVQCTKKLWYKDVSTGIKKDFTCNTQTPIVLNCDKNYQFFADTKCSPDTNCKMIVKGEFRNAAGALVIQQTPFNSTNSAFNIISGTPGNYTFTIRYYINDVECGNCTIPITVSCNPPVDCCKGGSWELFTVNDINYSCGKTIDWKCNTPLNFSARYNCNPSDPNCKTTLKWDIKNEDGVIIKYGDGGVQKFIYGSFTPVANGVYTITVYPFCNGKECPPCTFTIVVKDCNPPVDCCKNGNWYNKNWHYGNPLVLNGVGTPPVPLPASGTNLGIWPCSIPSYGFHCSFACANNCAGQVNYSVYNSATGILVSSLTVQNATYASIPAITTNGNYLLVIAAICGKDTCSNKLQYPFEIKCPPPTNCCQNAIQKEPSVYDAAGTNLATFSCAQPKTYYINAASKNCDKELIIKASANCGSNPNCPAKIVFTLKNTSTSVTITGTGILTIPTTLANGAYILTVDYYCGNTICKSCKFEIIKDCTPIIDDCCKNSIWSEKIHYTTGGFTGGPVPKPLPASGSNLGVITCGSTKQFKICYNCAQGCGTAQIKYDVYKAYSLVLISSTTVASCSVANITMPATAGNYQIRIAAICNGKECNAMDYFINTECKPVDCCKGGKWTSKSLDWDIKIKVELAEGTELSNDPVKKSIPQNKKDKKTPAGAKIKPVDIGGGQLNPLSGSLKVANCRDTLKINEGNEFTFNAAYTCNAALANCTGKVIAKVKDPNGVTYGTWPLPRLFNFATPGMYTVTYYAYCGETVCDSCTFYVNAAKDCCKGSEWKKAQYQVTNKKPNGDWDKTDKTYYSLPFTITSPIPVIKADVAIDLEKLEYSCAQGCTSGFILKRKNITTGVEEAPEMIAAGGTPSVYAKPYPQLITIIPTCGGISCGKPIVFRLECLSKDCRADTNHCLQQIILNPGFDEQLVGGNMPVGTSKNWSIGYGNPYINNINTSGFEEVGDVRLKGNNLIGNAISQILTNANKIISGKKYKVTFATRFIQSENSLDYAKLRFFAYNGNLPSGVSHPLPGATLSTIGLSGKIKDCGDWILIELPVWVANQNYQKIGIHSYSDVNTNTIVYVDNINICETDIDPCGDTVEISNESLNPNLLEQYDLNVCEPEEELEEYNTGPLSVLYGYNGTSSMYSNNDLSCLTLGGEIPDEVSNISCQDSLLALGISGIKCEDLSDSIDTHLTDTITIVPEVVYPPSDTLKVKNCGEIPVNPRNIKTAFHGRDIIFVHGIINKHLCDKVNPPSDINAYNSDWNWPDDPSEFFNGYFKNQAIVEWSPHIVKYLRSKGFLNRYLIVSYNSAQGIEAAKFAIIAQIKEAMETGQGVVYDKTDSRRAMCFGKEFIFVTHAEGSLVTDELLISANKHGSGNVNKYGKLDYLLVRCKGHIAIRGTFYGSHFSNLVVAAPFISPSLSYTLYNSIFCKTIIDPKIIRNSMYYETTTKYVNSAYGLNRITGSSKITFTISGGHPTAVFGNGNLILPGYKMFKLLIAIGFDDGKTVMNSSSGRSTPINYMYLPTGLRKVFDMGISKFRAIPYYLNQKGLTGVNGSVFWSSTPYLSPTGMVQPILYLDPSTMINNLDNNNNIYPFVQSSSQSLLNAFQGNSGCEYEPTDDFVGNHYSNTEEQLVVDDNSLYSYFINPAIIDEMEETVKGKFIKIPKIKIIKRKGIPKPTLTFVKKYIWKRTYHNLKDNCMFDIDYAYKYLFPN